MNPDAMILDNWAALSHKAALDPHSASAPGLTAPSWVGRDNQRRLTAYMILAAYRENVSRWFVRAASEEIRDIRREYGEPDLLMRQVAASVLGRGSYITVVGAEDKENGAEAGRQDEIHEWADFEDLDLELLNAEQECLSLGDVVLWLTYSAKKNRVRFRVMDPGFYFPVYGEDDDPKDFPNKAHLCWEYEKWDQLSRTYKRYVRRITFELVDVEPYSVAYQDSPAVTTCLMTDATWLLDDLDYELRNGGPDGFVTTKATFRTNDAGQLLDRLDLGIDFIPLVHIANFGGKPWGRSILTSISHILDDLQMADTDAAEAADVAGAPPIVVAGADTSDPVETWGPKTMMKVPTGGQASVLDTSKGLESLHAHTDKLFRRATQTARVPREILGITGAAEVPSGTALALAFNPFKMLIGELRLSRRRKYALMLKMVQRLMIVFDQWQGPVQPAEVEFGAALPEDLAGLIGLLKEMAGGDKPLLSRLTALEVAIEGGFPGIEDPSEEIRRVLKEDFDAARLISTATGSEQLAAEHLGLTLPDYVVEGLKNDAKPPPPPVAPAAPPQGQAKPPTNKPPRPRP